MILARLQVCHCMSGELRRDDFFGVSSLALLEIVLYVLVSFYPAPSFARRPFVVLGCFAPVCTHPPSVPIAFLVHSKGFGRYPVSASPSAGCAAVLISLVRCIGMNEGRERKKGVRVRGKGRERERERETDRQRGGRDRQTERDTLTHSLTHALTHAG